MPQFDVQIFENPLDRRGELRTFPVGTRLDQTLEGCVPARYKCVLFSDDGHYEVPFNMFRYTRPKAGVLVVMIVEAEGPVIPLGIGILSAAAAPAIASTVVGATSLVAGSFAAGVVTAGVTAAVSVGGALLANALIPPPSMPQPSFAPQASPQPTPQAATFRRRETVGGSPVYSITGSSNQMNPRGPIPIVYGRHRTYPPMSAKGFGAFVGNDAVFYARFCAGYGPMFAEEIRLGNTPIWKLPGVELEFSNFDRDRTLARIPQIAGITRAWRQGSERIQLGHHDIEQEWTNSQLLQGEPFVRATAENTSDVIIDLEFPALIRYDNEQRRHQATVWFNVTITGPGTTINQSIKYSATSSSAVRRSRWFKLSTAGTWTVTVTRTTPDRDQVQDDGSAIYDTSFITSIRSLQPGGLPSTIGVAQVAVRALASDQINGQMDTFNMVVQRLVPVWNGSSWSAPVPNKHPAWAYCDMLRGPGARNPLPNSAIDLPRMVEWEQREPGRELNVVIDQSITVGEGLDLAAAAGRARRTFRDVKRSVILDNADQDVVGMLTPRNSAKLLGSLTFPKSIHAFRANVIAEDDDWQVRTITDYAPGYNAGNATEIEIIDLTGVTISKGNLKNAHDLLQYYLRVHVLRPEEWEVEVSLEHFPWELGSKLRFGHSVPMIAVDSQRVAAINGMNVTFDGRVRADAGFLCQCHVRQPDGNQVSRQGEVNSNGTVTLSDVSGVSVGDLVLIDGVSQSALEVLVRDISVIDARRAKVRVVPASPDVLLVDGPTPEYEPSITLASSFRAPVPLTVRRTFSGITATLTDAAGNETPRIGVQLDFVSLTGEMPAHVEAQYRIEGEEEWSSVVELPFAELFFIEVPEQFETYETRIRSKSRGSFVSDWSAITRTYVALDLENPGPVVGFRVQVSGDQAVLTWDRVNSKIDYYQIRFTPYPQGGWARATVFLDKVVGTQAVVPARTGAYLIKGVSTAGQFASEERAVVIESTSIVRQVVEEYDFAPFVAQAPDWDVENAELVSSDTAPTGEPITYWKPGEFVDLGRVYTVVAASVLDAQAFAKSFNIYDVENIYDVPNIYGETRQDWEVWLEYRSSNSAWVSDAGPWDTDWTRVNFQEVQGRTFQFRIRATTQSPQDGIRVYEAKMILDVPDREEAERNILVPVDGLEIRFAQAFWEIKSIQIDKANLPSGVRHEITNVTRGGFDLRLFDSADNPIAGEVDWFVAGYGREQV